MFGARAGARGGGKVVEVPGIPWRRTQLRVVLAVGALGLVTACLPDQGFEVRVNNPCDRHITVQAVSFPMGTDPDDREFPTVREIAPFGSTTVSFIPYDDIAVEVSAPGPGWSDLWIDPKRGESREFTIDPSVCN